MFSDEEIKKIKREYRRLKSYKKCAEKNNISVYMAKKLIKGGANEKNKKRVKMKSVCENAGLQGDVYKRQFHKLAAVEVRAVYVGRYHKFHFLSFLYLKIL